MIEVETHGLKLTVNENAANDMNYVEMLGELDDGNILVFPKLCKLLFGKEQYAQILDAIKTDDGRAPVTDMVDFFSEVMSKAGGNLKN